MHFCTARITITGDLNNVRYRDHWAPVSWPEIEVIKALHGDDSVQGIETFAQVPQPPKAERERLVEIYGEEVVSHIWGGNRPPYEMDCPNGALKPGLKWFNPITHEAETVPGDPEPLFPEEPEPEKKAARR